MTNDDAIKAARVSAIEEADKVAEGMHEEDRPDDYAYAIRALLRPVETQPGASGFDGANAYERFTASEAREAVRALLPLTDSGITSLSRDAQIAYCLNKFGSFEAALVRAVERHSGIGS